MESFFLSETAKYLFLLGSGAGDLPDFFVLTTEGHLLPPLPAAAAHAAGFPPRAAPGARPCPPPAAPSAVPLWQFKPTWMHGTPSPQFSEPKYRGSIRFHHFRAVRK